MKTAKEILKRIKTEEDKGKNDSISFTLRILEGKTDEMFEGLKKKGVIYIDDKNEWEMFMAGLKENKIKNWLKNNGFDISQGPDPESVLLEIIED